MNPSSRRQAKLSSIDPSMLEAPTTLDSARCPKCESPMAARHGSHGPYFHCNCRRNRTPAPKQNKNSAS